MLWSGTGPAFTNTATQEVTQTRNIAGLLRVVDLYASGKFEAACIAPVLVDAGLLDHVGNYTRKYLPRETCAIISDSNVAPLFADRVEESLESAGFRPTLITIPAGEKSKTLEQAGAICDQMIAAGLDRKSFVIGLGGGMIGDISGFVAAIYHRGIPHVQIPTTLLAMVDSSIGGKTGVDTRAGKEFDRRFPSTLAGD